MGAADGEYHDAISFRFFIGAVARAYQPGCKLDTMLVLEGAQGTFKSTAVALLFGKSWFGDHLPPTNTKDASSYLKGSCQNNLA
ncbi:MAG: VapE domain-containing protein [Roseobacter sp.]|uniref:VapE domain-containing protein n=1 Tax=Tateyamaria sp. TaxID=1929288 RepID=UPI00328A739D